MKITALAGGVGGAKLAQGLKELLSPEELKIIVNTGDDFWHLGLFICPDLDTVMYTLADIANKRTGWGIQADTFRTMSALEKLGRSEWFHLGDIDLATHLERTRRIRAGESLTKITQELSTALGLRHRILPMTDQYVPTFVETSEFGLIPFQEYFVKHHFSPKVNSFKFKDIEIANPTEEVLVSLNECDAVVICPSNPFVSIDPIIAIKGIKELLQKKLVVCVSPIVGGKAINGPLGKMFFELGYDPNPLNIAKHYSDFLNVIYIDHKDHIYQNQISRFGIICIESDIILPNIKERIRMAKQIIDYLKKK